MTRETKAKAIGKRGYTYHITQFGAREGGRVWVHLLKIIGSITGGAVSEHEDSGPTIGGVPIKTIGRVVLNFAQTITEKDSDYLCDTFMRCTAVSGGSYQNRQMSLSDPDVFDLHFAGAYTEMYQWLLFAIEEVNYHSFFPAGGLVAFIKAQASKESAEPESTSPSTSEQTGPSGES